MSASSVHRRLATLGVIAGAALGAHAEPMKNWFDDPFFTVRSAVLACPLPRGPFTTEAQRRIESHERAERGTTCWLAKQCDRPNAYWYDRDIAAAVKAKFDATPKWRQASLWVTVQRRLVWVEGCVPAGYREGEIEAWLKDVPELQIVYVNVMRAPRAKPPYRVMPADAAASSSTPASPTLSASGPAR